ncbi:diguanylate cyclase [Limimaricola sp. G21655-S1]|uniref:diguanylate cyclase n=1 Tax=Limimaricola sp. G21655-S1 TaxID=3014768 RepID=UPI0022AF0265|nr:diguanylate cyclase [Limimaricola sp. G21655-S1]MCZ4260374.1 diguanylate cyclase [Limimaricola sp. G21655-S1]
MGPNKDMLMSGRILIVDGIATQRGAHDALLAAAGFECLHCRDGAVALARLPDPGIDLLLLPLDGAADPAEARGLLERLRAGPATTRLPVVVTGRWPDPGCRLALLRAGADEVAEAPMQVALLQARIRNLMRARDTEGELSRRAATHQALGFCEAATGFTPRQKVAVITPRAENGTVARLGLRGATRRIAPQQSFAAEAGEEDLYVIDGAALRAEGQPSRELFRIVAELRSRSATRRAAQLVMLPEPGREAAMLLDLGADDVVPAGVLPEEIAFRAARLLARKALADRLRATERQGLQAALTDELTGLWNRRYALPHLARLIDEARKRRRPIAVMLLDIDHFKMVNDRHGHAAGDRVLAQVARRLRDGLRPADLLARIGGEEFLVAMPETSLEQARGAAERLRLKIRNQPFVLPGEGLPCEVTVSVGVATGPCHGAPATEAETLMRHADAALYAAKQTGRNRVTVSPSAA